MQEPQPPLRKRQWDLGRPRHSHERRAGRLALGQSLRQRFHGRRLEQRTNGEFNVQAIADAADQPRRQQRVTAEREEVVVDADVFDPQHLGEQRAENLFLAACAARAWPRA